MTKKQENDLECIKYFIPECMKHIEITDNDIELFFEYSDKGKNKDLVGDYIMNGFNALVQGKRWRGIHIHEMYENGVLDGSMPYFTILGGNNTRIKRKWWQLWKKKYTFKNNPKPRVVVDFLKKEMFKGRDSKIIEKTYQCIIQS